MELGIIIQESLLPTSPQPPLETTWTTLVNYVLIKDNSLSLAFPEHPLLVVITHPACQTPTTASLIGIEYYFLCGKNFYITLLTKWQDCSIRKCCSTSNILTKEVKATLGEIPNLGSFLEQAL